MLAILLGSGYYPSKTAPAKPTMRISVSTCDQQTPAILSTPRGIEKPDKAGNCFEVTILMELPK